MQFVRIFPGLVGLRPLPRFPGWAIDSGKNQRAFSGPGHFFQAIESTTAAHRHACPPQLGESGANSSSSNDSSFSRPRPTESFYGVLPRARLEKSRLMRGCHSHHFLRPFRKFANLDCRNKRQFYSFSWADAHAERTVCTMKTFHWAVRRWPVSRSACSSLCAQLKAYQWPLRATIQPRLPCVQPRRKEPVRNEQDSAFLKEKKERKTIRACMQTSARLFLASVAFWWHAPNKKLMHSALACFANGASRTIHRLARR